MLCIVSHLELYFSFLSLYGFIQRVIFVDLHKIIYSMYQCLRIDFSEAMMKLSVLNIKTNNCYLICFVSESLFSLCLYFPHLECTALVDSLKAVV